jgi:hypothetical protein
LASEPHSTRKCLRLLTIAKSIPAMLQARVNNCSATPDRYEQMMHSCPSCR